MSTRAVYTFTGRNGTYNVYKHHDNYPKGAIGFINAALETGSKRSNDLAVSFIVANNTKGHIELTDHYDRHDDLDYRYEISRENDDIFIISAYKKNYDNFNYELIFNGSFDEFKKYKMN